MNKRYNEYYNGKLLAAFHEAAMFLKERVDKDGWHWSSNYLREHVRCSSGLKFSNTVSPDLLRELRDKYPELRAHIEIVG